jgi:hypothetical protein
LSLASFLLLLPVVCLSQTAETASQQEVVRELKEVRASLARLAEVVEQGQKVQWALARIQIDQSQVAALEERRSRLSAQERQLTEVLAVASDSSDEESSSAPRLERVDRSTTGEPELVMSPGASPSGGSRAQASETLDEVQKEISTVEQEIARLRKRIASNEKYVASAMR